MKATRTASQPSSTTDLLVLAHPLVILSVIGLLINDHILKVYLPSWLTGKLSDFAGLFFFPILLSVLLQLFFQRLRLSPRKIALTAFGVTALWFTLIKTLPYFSDLTESILSFLLMHKTQIICDPSDLVALIMLWPAWKLLNTANQQPKRNPKVAYGMMFLAAFATAATSPAIHIIVNHLITYDNMIYADYNYIFDRTIPYSKDGGQTWLSISIDQLPDPVKEKIGQPAERPVKVCLPEQPKICYRTGDEVILQSQDGGQTWHTDWSVPAGRKKFMDRYSTRNIELGPYDLIAMNFNGTSVVVAAIGSEGVIVKSGSSDWKLVDTGWVIPTPYRASQLEDSYRAILLDLIFFSITSILLFLIWIIVRAGKKDNLGMAVVMSIFPVILSPLLFIGHDMFYTSTWMAGLILASYLIVAVVFSILNSSTGIFQQANDLYILAGVWLASEAPFFLWSFGVIPFYTIALVIALVIQGGTLVWLLQRKKSKEVESTDS